MGNKLRKILAWVWRGKERIVLVVMVGVLLWRVHGVVWPEAGVDEVVVPTPPKRSGEVEVPMPAAPAFFSEDIPFTRRLVDRNPWTLNPPGGRDTQTEESPENPGIYLEQIILWPDGAYRARLRTERESYYAVEGEEFENFSVMEIDPDGGTCVVLDSKSRRMITLEVSG